MSLPTYDWLYLAKERTEAPRSAAETAAIALALFASLLLFALCYVV